MEPRRTRQPHHVYQELLGSYALGAVTPTEASALAEHMATCQACRVELAELRVAVYALPLAVEEMEPPPILRDRLLAAVGQERSAGRDSMERPPDTVHPGPRPAAPPVMISARRARGTWLPWAAVAALLLVTIGLLGWNVRLRDTDEPITRTIALEATQPDVPTTGEVRHLAEQGVLLLTLRDVPDLPDDQVYQVWLIAGTTPFSAGIFTAETSEFAIAADPAAFDVIAITVEPGPMGVPAPTSDPILAAALDPA